MTTSAAVLPLPPDEAGRLAALHAYGILDSGPEAAYDDIVRLAARICGAPTAAVTLIDGQRYWIKAATSDVPREGPREVAFCNHTVAGGVTLVVSDLADDPRFDAHPMVAGAPGVRFYAGAPLVAPGGHAVGSLCVIDAEPRALEPWQREALEALARQAGALLELRRQNGRLEREAAERARAERLVRESEARFRRLAAASTDGVAITESGMVIEANDALADMLGYDAGELLGLGVGELVAPEYRLAVAARVRDNVEGCYAAFLLRRDGTSFPAEVNARQLEYQGRVLRVTAIRDLSDRWAAERAKNEFVSTVTHELRTPLTSIRGSLGLIEGGAAGPVSERGLDLVRIARVNADRLIRLINDILDLEKIDAGNLALRLAAVDAGELVTGALEGIQGMAEQHRVRLRAELSHAAPVNGDRDRLVQVLTNLVSNAIKFSPPDAEVVVRVAAGPPGTVRVSVVDRGAGIKPEDVGRLFRRFSQLDSSDSRQRGGTGLGLAISRSIVEQHGGRIGVRTAVGSGSEFWFELPAVALADGVPALGDLPRPVRRAPRHSR